MANQVCTFGRWDDGKGENNCDCNGEYVRELHFGKICLQKFGKVSYSRDGQRVESETKVGNILCKGRR